MDINSWPNLIADSVFVIYKEYYCLWIKDQVSFLNQLGPKDCKTTLVVLLSFMQHKVAHMRSIFWRPHKMAGEAFIKCCCYVSHMDYLSMCLVP